MRVGKISALKWAFDDDFEFEELSTNIDMKGSIIRLNKIQHDKRDKLVRASKNKPYRDAQEYERINRKSASKRKKTARIMPLPDEHVRGAIPSPEGFGDEFNVSPPPPDHIVHSDVPEVPVPPAAPVSGKSKGRL